VAELRISCQVGECWSNLTLPRQWNCSLKAWPWSSVGSGRKTCCRGRLMKGQWRMFERLNLLVTILVSEPGHAIYLVLECSLPKRLVRRRHQQLTSSSNAASSHDTKFLHESVAGLSKTTNTGCLMKLLKDAQRWPNSTTLCPETTGT
jgi:hypothetical protein